jgi:hypothetical protein
MTALLGNERTLKIVVGYVPGLDRIPRHLAALSLRRRYAFVLDTYRTASVDAYFDVEIYAAVLRTVLTLVGATSLSVVQQTGEVRAFESGEAEQVLTPEEPPREIQLLQATETVAALVSEPWVTTGGPEPYHDSYTVALFCRIGDPSQVVERVRRAVEDVGAVVTEVVSGGAEPEPPSLLARIAERLGLGPLLRMP